MYFSLYFSYGGFQSVFVLIYLMGSNYRYQLINSIIYGYFLLISRSRVRVPQGALKELDFEKKSSFLFLKKSKSPDDF